MKLAGSQAPTYWRLKKRQVTPDAYHFQRICVGARRTSISVFSKYMQLRSKQCKSKYEPTMPSIQKFIPRAQIMAVANSSATPAIFKLTPRAFVGQPFNTPKDLLNPTGQLQPNTRQTEQPKRPVNYSQTTNGHSRGKNQDHTNSIDNPPWSVTASPRGEET